MPHGTEKQQRNRSAKDAAVDGESTFPDAQNPQWVGGEHVPRECDVVQARTDNGGWNQAQREAPEQIVFREEDYFLKDDPELGHQIEWLVPNAQKNQMEPIRMTLAPRGRSCVEPPHAGEEMGYVLEGSILLTLGKKTYRIQKGETFYFPAGQEHWLEAGKWGATILWISSPPNF